MTSLTYSYGLHTLRVVLFLKDYIVRFQKCNSVFIDDLVYPQM